MKSENKILLLKWEGMANHLHHRVNFLMMSLPGIESLILKIQESMAKKELTQTDFDKLLSFYSQVYGFYNRSLDLIRKLMVHFPMERTEAENELLSLYNSMEPEERVKLLESLKNGSAIEQSTS